MKLQEFKSLSDIYAEEEDFSEDLANTLDALCVGEFDNAQCEVPTVTRRADIVAYGDSDKLVVENQFGTADWDHWGRLEGYARYHNATVAVLVAEGFEGLMTITCQQRNKESDIRWYLIRAKVNSHDELCFDPVVESVEGVPSEPDSGYSEFWEPIRQDKNCLFSGKSVSNRDDGWIDKTIRGVSVSLLLGDYRCAVKLAFKGERRQERREEVMELFPDSEYCYKYSESPKFVYAVFEVIDKGRKTPEHWDEARKKLVNMGTRIYNRIKESDL